jgi:L-cysteate sulfo-lyase
VFALAEKTTKFMGISGSVKREAVVANGDYVGPGYGLPTDGMIEATELLARQEGILLDPVYSGKGMAGLIDLIRKGKFRKDENIVFLHTGGSAGLFAYRKTFS